MMSAPAQHDRYRKLVEISNIINSTLEIDALLDLAIETVSSTLDAEGCSLVLRQPGTDDLYFRSAAGAAREEIKKIRLKLGDGVAGLVALEGKPLLITDAQSDTRVRHDISRRVGMPVRSILCTPLSVEGKVVGSIEVINPRSKPNFDDEDMQFLSAVSDSVAIAVRNARLFTQVSSEKETLSRVLGLQPTIIGNSEPMKTIFTMVNKIMRTDVTILITGETGTGKGLIARFIHENSQRRHQLLVEVNCAAIPDTLIESELFGHEKGSFTGASYQRKGKFELADNGTLCLDEIGELSPRAQAKLLRAIEEQRFERIGSNTTLSTDVRVLATTNRDLAQSVKEGQFRNDLYYRLNQIEVHIPPLRERREDILLLVEHYIEEFNGQFEKNVVALSVPAKNFLLDYDWPGNVRELKNMIKRAVLLCDEEEIRCEHFPLLVQPGQERAAIAGAQEFPNLGELERMHIIAALQRAEGVKKKAADLLGISRSTLDRKIEAHKIAL
ncbi:MAG: GAF domain-containing protein [Candidatus Abyssobacteria bacterium SURF_17]|uniref:GAF domain-containing protein n=1 Tax=Candidatus Abyssobacteria bacterium SURF_17 TaxID=2093361 RepID=A0A419F209_9BACT|nr:MAG: GAF domain-containing protein [Candidatus Abyssubacteria bacterium SURF_17]